MYPHSESFDRLEPGGRLPLAASFFQQEVRQPEVVFLGVSLEPRVAAGSGCGGAAAVALPALPEEPAGAPDPLHQFLPAEAATALGHVMVVLEYGDF